VYDVTAVVAGSLLLGGPDSQGKIAGWLGPLGNLIVPPMSVGLLGERQVLQDLHGDDFDGYILTGETCDPSTGCCLTVYVELRGLTAPFGADVSIRSAGCSDPTMSCNDEVWGAAFAPPVTPSTTTTTTLPPVIKAQFGDPSGVVIDASGNMCVMAGNDRVQKFDATGAFVTAWGSYGSSEGQFVGASSLATDSSGNVYVADTYNARVQKFDAGGNFLLAWGSGGSDEGQFTTPLGIAIDGGGNVYVSDQHRVSKFDLNGTFLTMWGRYGSGNGQFMYPAGVATDASGNVYVTDEYTDSVQKFGPDGTFLTRWGSTGSGDGQFNFPTGVATDSSGNVYVADIGDIYARASGRIQKFDANGNFLATFGRGELGCASGVATDPSGNVYLADGCNHRIVKFDASGTLLLTWGRVCASCS